MKNDMNHDHHSHPQKPPAPEDTDQRKLLLKLEDVCFTYPGSDDPVLDHLDMSFRQGDRVGLMAPNGSGKTTLFHIVMGLLKPDQGRIEAFGSPLAKEKDFEAVRRRIGLLFQDADDQLFSPTVLEDVAFGPLNLGQSPQQAREVALETLDLLGLEGFENRITHRLSTGQKRLVSLATVLSMRPEVVLLDEPSNGLDEKTREHLMQVLIDLDISYILISHDNHFLFELTGSIFSMRDGKIYPGEVMHCHFHTHPHTTHAHEDDYE